MKHPFLQDHNGVLMDVAKELDLVDNVSDADGVVLWQDVMGVGRGVAMLAKQQKKPVIVVQHGANSHIDYCSPNRYPLLADKICVWGQKSKDALLEAGVPEKKIVITGSTIFSHLKPKKETNNNIVFRPAHWDTKTLKENKEIADVLNNLKSYITITTKMIETQDTDGFKNVVKSHRDKPEHLDICADVLSTADLVVSVGGDGTFEMLAYALDIPVIMPNIWDNKPFLGKATPEIIYSDACELININDLLPTIYATLINPNKKKAQRKQVAEYWAGTNIEDPLKEILNVIRNA